MSKFRVLCVQVGDWAVTNFGKTPVEYLNIVESGVELDFLAPLLGIGEEIGELNDAIDAPLGSNYCANIIDAIGDIGIYLCDYCKRRNLFPIIDNVNEVKFIGQRNLTIPYGKLLHAELKHAQKIRGMDVVPEFMDKARNAVTELYYVLDNVSRRYTGNGIDNIAERVFREMVAKRNWKNNNATGENSGQN